MKDAEQERARLLDFATGYCDCERYLGAIGPVGFFEIFYDLFPHRDDAGQSMPVSLTAAELDAFQTLKTAIDDACDATPQDATEAELRPWFDRIEAAAAHLSGRLKP